MLRNKTFWLGLIGLLFCHLAIILNWQPIKEWLYVAVWWSYILFIDGIIYRIKGNSLIISRTKSFFLMLPWSVVIWLVFELFNVGLRNWYYASMTPSLLERWSGYFIAFATVLPGIFETSELLEAIGIFRSNSLPVSQIDNSRYSRAYLIIGIILFLLPIILPKYFFPVIWLSFIFLLEPINYWLSKKSGGLLLRKQWGTILRLSFAGLICGLLWEVWNWHAVAHWVYALPYFHYLQIFQMPVLGYLGFMPFAWECYLMYEFVVLSGFSKSWLAVEQEKTEGQTTPMITFILTYALMIIFIMVVFNLIDNFTIRSFTAG
jgi:hypothetical protein